MLTTTEAAALLAECGLRAITADAVKRQCYRGVYPNAKHYAGSGRGLWLIPLEDIERYIASKAPPTGQTPPPKG